MRHSRPLRRVRLLLVLILPLVTATLAAQERVTWEVLATPDTLAFFVSRMLNKQTVAAADAAHYAFVASRGSAGYVYTSDDTASTLDLVRVDQHPILHYDLAYPTVDDLFVIADSVEWLDARWDPVRGMVFRSSDRGATWDTTRMPEGVTLARVAMVDAMEGVAATTKSGQVFYRTTDGWRTWQEVALPQGVTGIGDLRAPAPGVYVVNGSRRTTDAGATWTVSSAMPSPGVSRFHFLDALTGWGIGGLPNNGDHRAFDRIITTTDGGVTWTPLVEATEPRIDRLLEIAFADDRHGIATGKIRRVLSTVDGGLTWSQEALPDSLNEMLELTCVAHPTPEVAVAVGNGAILRRILEPAANAPDEASVIGKASVAPNPAAGVAVAEVTLARAADVVILIVDALGEAVAAIDAGATSPGVHRITLALDALPTGTYTLVIDADGARETMRLAVTR